MPVPDASTPILPAPSPIQPKAWPWNLLAACLILGSAAMHLAYLANNCPLDLAPDEAHYWDWSRHLDWSYYSKGPLVAYLIRISVTVAGSWSERLTGDGMLAVRLPAVACGSLFLLGLYVLTRQIYGRPGLATGVVATALTMPVVAAGSTLMTIDAPFTWCWCWALVFGYQAMCRGSKWAWPLAGLMVGLGILAKYTMILWPVSAALFLLTDATRRRMLQRPGFWIMTLIAAACCLPILIWNVQHDWLGLRHVTRLAGLDGSSASIKWLGPFSYFGQQALLHLVFWFGVWLKAMIVYRPWKREWLVVSGRVGRVFEAHHSTGHPDGGPRRLGPPYGENPRHHMTDILATPQQWRFPSDAGEYLWWFSAPMFGVFLFFSLKTGGGEPNWPVAAYISGLVLAAGWLTTQLHSPHRVTRRLTAGGLSIACGFALAITILMHHTTWAQPLLARLSGPPTTSRPLPMRRFDPTCRLRGWRQLAAEVDQLQIQLRAEGINPIVAAAGWSMPGELAFYCHDHPTVYSLGLALADRHSQYDLWRPNPVFDPDRFRGRTMIVVGELGPAIRQAFAQVDAPRKVTFFDDGYPLARWTITVCRYFRGFPDPPAGSNLANF